MSLICYFLIAMASNGLSERGLVREIDRLLQAQEYADGFWGIAVWAPARNRFIYTRHPDQNFRTASNLKILTTLLAMDYLGPQYRFETLFGTQGALRDQTLMGDLFIRGGGDPAISGNYSAHTWTTEDLLAPVIESLKAKGIHQIAGDLVAVEDFFDDRMVQKSWEWDDVGFYYAAPVSALAIDNGWIDIFMETDENGHLSYRMSPQPVEDLAIQFDLTHDPGKMQIAVDRRWGTDQVRFHGNMPPCSVYAISLSTWAPSMRFLTRFRAMLQDAGIQVMGRNRVVQEAVEMEVLAVYQSDTLGELGKTLMKASQNHYADLFLKTTASHLTQSGSFENGAALAREFLRSLAPDGDSGFNLRDGSGLSVQNYLKPNQVVNLLRHGLTADYAAQWLATFPVMNREGTLARRGENIGERGMVWAKTGYIYRARNLSGYVETGAGEPLVFSILVNNYGSPTAAINRAQDAICALLMQLKPNRMARKNTLWRHRLSRMHSQR